MRMLQRTSHAFQQQAILYNYFKQAVKYVKHDIAKKATKPYISYRLEIRYHA